MAYVLNAKKDDRNNQEGYVNDTCFEITRSKSAEQILILKVDACIPVIDLPIACSTTGSVQGHAFCASNIDC